MAHAKLGASKAHRWMTCPASVKLESNLPDSASFFAQEGTAAHALAEECLLKQKPPEEFIGAEFEGFTVDEDMANHVATYVDFCNSQEGDEAHVELRVDYSQWAEGGFGTADYVSIADGVLHVIDLKYGKGIKVNANRNEQLMLYGLGAAHAFSDKVDTVNMTIVQPRLDHIDTYSMRTKDLFKWADDVVKPAAELAMSTDANFNPTKKACHFCKAKPTCRHLAKHNYNLTLGSFENLDEPLVVNTAHLLSVEEISNLLPKMDALIGWAQSIQKHALKLLLDGSTLPNFKLVAGRSQRKWLDVKIAEEQLITLLGDEAYVSKLISPAQAEKAMGKVQLSEIANLIHKQEGKPIIAPDTDPRPALNEDPMQHFDNLTEK